MKIFVELLLWARPSAQPRRLERFRDAAIGCSGEWIYHNAGLQEAQVKAHETDKHNEDEIYRAEFTKLAYLEWPAQSLKSNCSFESILKNWEITHAHTHTHPSDFELLLSFPNLVTLALNSHYDIWLILSSLLEMMVRLWLAPPSPIPTLCILQTSSLLHTWPSFASVPPCHPKCWSLKMLL